MQIDKDKADLAIGNFLLDGARCGVAACLDMHYSPNFFLSKYPEKVTPIWNLIRLLPPEVWGFTLLSISSISIYFLTSSKVYARIGLKKKLKSEEIVLVPTRCKL